MRGIIIKDDYIGFTFAGKHSSQFGILSVSSGDRYTRTLSPEFNDIVANVNGADGTYYFGTNLTRRSFQLNCAYDTVTEVDIREMKEWLRPDIVSPLTFDEIPYIQFYAKVSSPPQFSFLAFEDEYGDRVYKGELSISFSCYDPYGYSVNKWIDNYTDLSPYDGNDIYLMANNVAEWSLSSRLQPKQKYNNYEFDVYLNEQMQLYNAGDMPAHYKLKIDLGNETSIKISLNDHFLQLDNLPGGLVEIDTKKRLVLLTKDNNTEIINDYITGGDFFLIPVSSFLDDIYVMKFNTSNFNSVQIEYQYRYR